MESIEKFGKTVEAAVAEALKELSATEDQVTIEILEEGSKGLFGVFGNRNAYVRVTKKEEPYNPEKKAVAFLSEMFEAMNLKVEIATRMEEKHLCIDLSGDSMGLLIGKRGQTLDAIQYLVNLVVNKENDGYLSVTLDTENYRERRKETLEALARNLAKKAKYTGKNVVLEPMNPYERRIIHSALQGDKQVVTYSEGEEPYRYIVIALKK